MVTGLDKKTALVLIDLQNGIVQLPTAHPIKDVLDNANQLISAFRKANLPVVLVNVNVAGAKWVSARKDTKTGNRPVPAEGSLDIASEIEKHGNDIYITKHTWNAFYETALDAELKKRDITGIVIAGVATSIGVEGTARAASERGYNLTFAQDAMTDMVAGAHENSLKYIFPRMGEVDTTEKIVSFLSN